MSTNLERYNKIKEAVIAANKEADKAEGAENQIMQQLKNDYDCDSLKKAKALLKKLEVEKTKEQEQVDKELIEIEKEYGEILDD